MSKLTIEVSDEVLQAITEEGQREFRNPSQQASYLLLTWAREGTEKRQKEAKATGKVLPNGSQALQPWQVPAPSPQS